MQEMFNELAPVRELEPEGRALEVARPAAATVTYSGELAANSPAAVMMQALSQGASLEQVEKMMDLQDRWEKREAEKAYSVAMAEFKSKAVVILKNKQVSFKTKSGDKTEYKHADLADVVDAVGPALSECGFSWYWRVTHQTPQVIEVTCYLKHRLGHCESVSLSGGPDQSGLKNSLQAISSTITYLERYTLKSITGVAEQGDDNDGADGAPPPMTDAELLKLWCARALAAKDSSAANRVFKDGRKFFNASKNLPAFNEFTRVAAEHGRALRALEEGASVREASNA